MSSGYGARFSDIRCRSVSIGPRCSLQLTLLAFFCAALGQLKALSIFDKNTTLKTLRRRGLCFSFCGRFAVRQ